jgi:Spy/CpxP family protein refolding chaperone
MISIRTLSTASLLGLLVAVAGCTGETGTTAAAAAPATAQESVVVAAATSPVAAHGPSRHRGGPASLLVAALHAPINLTDAQKATIEGALAANQPAARPAFDKTRATALAASIRAGKVDASNLQAPSQVDIAARMAAHRTAEASALSTLHATLTADQRRALVDAMTKREADHAAKRAANAGAPGAKAAHAGHARGGPMGPMGGMLKDLDLTQAQKDAIDAKLAARKPAAPTDAERAARKAQHETFRAEKQARLQSFAGDTFDANAFLAPPAGAPQTRGAHTDRFASSLAVITSVLDASQREKLATKIEAGPPARNIKAPQ